MSVCVCFLSVCLVPVCVSVCLSVCVCETSEEMKNFQSISRAGGRSVMVSLLPTKTLTIDGDTRLGQSGVPALL